MDERTYETNTESVSRTKQTDQNKINDETQPDEQQSEDQQAIADAQQQSQYPQPVSEWGDQRATSSGVSQQRQQQAMNASAQRQAATRSNNPKINVNGQEVDFYPAPVGHASGSMMRLAQRARESERTNAGGDMPSAAKQETFNNARVVPMPAGGIQQLATNLYPDDVNNQEAMDNHVFDLLTLNRDVLRDDTSHLVGQVVRIPS